MQKTDLEKFEQFFDSMGIEYLINTTFCEEYTCLSIEDDYVHQPRGACTNVVMVLFDENDKFVEFQCWGE